MSQIISQKYSWNLWKPISSQNANAESDNFALWKISIHEILIAQRTQSKKN
jgi:hypothetical protein